MPTNSTQPLFKCFVVMPFTETQHSRNGRSITITAVEWNHIFENWIKKAVESFKPHNLQCIRSKALPGNFIKGIVQELYSSEFVIADLTGSRPNVYYELGIRHALDTGTIMITQDFQAVPSDLKSYYCFQYNYTSEHHEYQAQFKIFESELHEKLAHFFETPAVSDNPVSDFLGHKNAFLDERFQREKAEMIYLMEAFFLTVESHFRQCEMLVKMRDDQPWESTETILLDSFSFDLLITRIVNTRWELIPPSMLQTTYDLLNMYRVLFLPIQKLWYILQVNPTHEGVGHFFELLDATMQVKQPEMKADSEKVLNELRNLSYSLTVTPRKTNSEEE